jgi:hypothetical protein
MCKQDAGSQIWMGLMFYRIASSQLAENYLSAQLTHMSSDSSFIAKIGDCPADPFVFFFLSRTLWCWAMYCFSGLLVLLHL